MATADVPAAASAVRTDFVELEDDVSHSPLWNKDLAPTPLSRRTWSTYNMLSFLLYLAFMKRRQ